MKYFYLIIFGFAICSCAQQGVTNDMIALNKNNNTGDIIKRDALIEAQTKVTIASETYKKLQGLWVNAVDTTSYFLIINNKKTDFNNNKFYLPESYFVIGDNCLGTDTTIKPEDEERYLSILNEMRQCYYIEKLTDTILELQHIGSDMRTKYTKNGPGGC